MTPESEIDLDFEITQDPETSTTYQLTDHKIQGFTDGLNALQQSIYKSLSTEMYEYPIYSFQYGIELENLIGKDITYVKMELERRIGECLLEDERIKSVDNFAFMIIGDQMQCTFDVKSIYGEITISKEVNV